jgi:serine/threonine-protein kinase
MGVILRVVDGPHQGEEFLFDRHDTFIVGRKDAHFSVPEDGFLSRHHFLIEIDPPRCQIKDLGSRNGTRVNGARVDQAPLNDGDTIQAGQSTFRLQIQATYDDMRPVQCIRCHTAMASAEIVSGIRPGEDSLQWVCEPCQLRARRYPTPPPGYWIERSIGGGGMGEVYLARRESDRQRVAIKMMIPTVATGERARMYFRRELEVLRDLRHPNIVAYDETYERDGQYQLVMEFVDGPNARQWVEQLGKPLPIDQAAWIGAQLLAALDHAHGKGYVHRDIKPSNLIVTGRADRPTVKLSDFGLAKSFRDNAGFTGLTHHGDIGGSVGFISPDHICEFRDVKEPADIYSAGATLYFLLTQQFPFLNFDPTKIDAYTMILEHPPVPLRAHRPDAPEALDRILRRSLEKKPKNRFPSAAAMRKALLQVLNETQTPS